MDVTESKGARHQQPSTSMSPFPDFGSNDLLEALAGLRILDEAPSLAQTLIDKRKKQWEEYCKRHTKLLNDWQSRKISRTHLKEYNYQPSGPRCLTIPESIVSNVYKELISEIPGVVSLKECSTEQYPKSMQMLLEAEEVYQAVAMRKYDRTVSLDFGWRHKRGENLLYCRINLPNLPNWSPSLVTADYVILYNDARSFAVVLQIKSIKDEYIYLPNDQIHLLDLATLEERLQAVFVSAGTPFRFCQMAIRQLQTKTSLRDIVFEGERPEGQFKIDLHRTNKMCLANKLNQLNDSQRDAVIGILRAECRPKPYILFGPPGTGKSHTMIAAVVQVYHRSFVKNDFRRAGSHYLDVFSDSFSDGDDSGSAEKISGKRARILVSVNSNTCTDDIYQKLRKELPQAKILRLSAGDSPPSPGCIDDIIVTTNIKAGCLFNRLSFDYVFVDEAGHANGAESLVPMCALKEDGCLVLAGDTKQLGPVVMSRQAAKLGLETSLLERLFEFDLYQRDSVTKKYDKRYITMLQECYRCDERILAPCNRLFYESDLVCKSGTPAGLLKLLNLTGPIQATSRVYGKGEKPEYSTSWRNFAEADACVDLIKRLYKMGIQPEQIGVTTPYKLQQREIVKKLKIALRFHSEHLFERFLNYQYIEKEWTEEQKLVLNSKDDDAKRRLYESLKVKHYKKVGDQYFQYEPRSYDDPVNLYERIIPNWVCKIDSIDAFQGNEREIMIISTVRTDANIRRLEFLNDARRFNVAVSRAKWLVFVIGSPYVLELGKYWPELIKDSKSEIDNWPLHVHDLDSFYQKPLFRTK